MKVRCVKLLDSNGRETTTSYWLRLDGVYEVLSLCMDLAGGVFVQLIGEKDPNPGFYPLKQFEVVDGFMSRNWVVHMRSDGGLHIGPAPWMVPGFWERYFEGDADAKETFERERLRISEGGDAVDK